MPEFWGQITIVAESIVLGFFLFMAIYQLILFSSKIEKAGWAAPAILLSLLLALYTLFSGQTKVLFRAVEPAVLERILGFTLSAWLPAIILVLRVIREKGLTRVETSAFLTIGIAWMLTDIFLPAEAYYSWKIIRHGLFTAIFGYLLIAFIRRGGGKGHEWVSPNLALSILLLTFVLDLYLLQARITEIRIKPIGAAFFTFFLVWDRLRHQRNRGGGQTVGIEDKMPEILTAREKEIVRLLVKGRSYREIAGDLFISEKTVNNHIQKIYRKTGVNSRGTLVELFMREHLP